MSLGQLVTLIRQRVSEVRFDIVIDENAVWPDAAVVNRTSLVPLATLSDVLRAAEKVAFPVLWISIANVSVADALGEDVVTRTHCSV